MNRPPASCDPDILSHKGLFSILTENPENARDFIERIPVSAHTGNAVLLAEACLFMGDRTGAVKAIAELLDAAPENRTGKEWKALLSIDAGRPAYEASEQWNARYHLFRRSRLFTEMCKSNNQDHGDPVSWYLRRGIVEIGLNPVFTPVLYWGLHNNVFKSGMDPLVHYIESGKAERCGCR